MSGDKPQLNGNEAKENEDVVMDEDEAKTTQSEKDGKDKDADEEMTVVVPPSKKSSGSETAVNGASEGKESPPEEPEVDPKEKAIGGKCTIFTQLILLLICYLQKSKAISLSLTELSANSILDLR